MKKALVLVTVLVLVQLLYAQDYSDWNTKDYFKTATVESLKRYLKAGADANAQGEYYGLTPLHHAAWFNTNPEIITALLNGGAKIDTRDEDGSTPLHVAAWFNKNPEVITALLNGGADANARNIFDDTPLHQAARWNENPKVITALLNGGARIDARDASGKTAWDIIQNNEALKGTDIYWQINDLRD